MLSRSQCKIECRQLLMDAGQAYIISCSHKVLFIIAVIIAVIIDVCC